MFAQRPREVAVTDSRHPRTEKQPGLHGQAAELLNLSARLIASPDLDAAVSEALAASIALHKADFAALKLRDPATGQLRFSSQQGFDPALLAAWAKIPADADCACRRALRLGRAVVVPDIRADDDFALWHPLAARAGVRGVQSTPLTDRAGNALGTISTYFREPHTPSPFEIEAIGYYARQAAEIVTRCRREAEARQAAEKQRLLGEELRHRVRNLLTVIEAISWETARSNPAPQDFTAIFTGRLHALYRAQNLLMDFGANGCDMKTLVREQLMLPEGDARVSCSGPALVLDAADSLDLGLLFYELGTNARKYGALSSEQGHVAVEWKLPRVTPGTAEGSALKLRWTERDGPVVRAPASQGFGSKLIRRVAKGNAQVRYDPAGVVCDLTIPLRGVGRG